MKTDLLITNCCILIHPGREEILPAGFIAIRDGRISEVGPMTGCPVDWTGTVLDGQGQLAMPGLINGHCHAAMTLFRGMADDLPLASWLSGHIFPAERRHVTPEMVYWCTRLAAAEMLLGGITTVADGYFFEDEAARAFIETGIRSVPAQAVIDFPVPGVEDPARAVDTARSFLERWQGRHPLVTPAVFAHSPYTCSASTLRRAKELTRSLGALFFIHAGETSDELAGIATPQGTTPIRHLDALGLLDRDTICVHCVWADEEDREILARRESGVVVCPQSHLKLASGMAPLAAMLRQGLRIALGTDGPASNNALDLFREMDLGAKGQKIRAMDPTAAPAGALLMAATHGGADLLAADAGLGTLATGAPADLVLIDLRRPHLQPFFSSRLLVYAGRSADVTTVIVNGQLVVHRGRLLTIDLAETLEQVRCLARQMC